jgi:hypothetical protein
MAARLKNLKTDPQPALARIEQGAKCGHDGLTDLDGYLEDEGNDEGELPHDDEAQ